MKVSINEILVVNPYKTYVHNSLQDVLEHLVTTRPFYELLDTVRNFAMDLRDWGKTNQYTGLMNTWHSLFAPYSRTRISAKRVMDEIRDIIQTALYLDITKVEDLALITALLGLTDLNSQDKRFNLQKSIIKEKEENVLDIYEVARNICLIENLRLDIQPYDVDTFIDFVNTTLYQSLIHALEQASAKCALYDKEVELYKTFRFHEYLRGFSSLGNLLMPEDIEHFSMVIDRESLLGNVLDKSQVHLSEIVNNVEHYLVKAVDCFPYTRVKIDFFGLRMYQFKYTKGDVAQIAIPISNDSRVQLLYAKEVMDRGSYHTAFGASVDEIGLKITDSIINLIDHVKIMSSIENKGSLFMLGDEKLDIEKLSRVDHLGVQPEGSLDMLGTAALNYTNDLRSPINVGHSTFIKEIQLSIDSQPMTSSDNGKNFGAIYSLNAVVEVEGTSLRLLLPMTTYTDATGHSQLVIANYDVLEGLLKGKEEVKQFLILKNTINFTSYIEMRDYSRILSPIFKIFKIDKQGVGVRNIDFDKHPEAIYRAFSTQFKDVGPLYAGAMVFTSNKAINLIEDLSNNVCKNHLITMVREVIGNINIRSIYVKSYSLKATLRSYVNEVIRAASQGKVNSDVMKVVNDPAFQDLKNTVMSQSIEGFIISVAYLYIVNELWKKFGILPKVVGKLIDTDRKFRRDFTQILYSCLLMENPNVTE